MEHNNNTTRWGRPKGGLIERIRGRPPGFTHPPELKEKIRRGNKINAAIRRGMREFQAMEAAGH